MLKLKILSFVMAGLTVIGPASARAGRETGNGGDAIALEFASLAQMISDELEKNRRTSPKWMSLNFAGSSKTP
ncbi:MAG: hypothetical protein RBT63_11690 [Bdellovibrionales bacterium]|jgi:hypothetical protein|nr:hypothetical protein [Bdellovibrionales bacterium]